MCVGVVWDVVWDVVLAQDSADGLYVVIQGSGCISISNGPPLEFTEGDILVIPQSLF